MTSFRRSASLATALALGLLLNAPARAQSAAEFYRGKTITHILAVPNGASWGLYLQTFIEHFRNHVPGGPNIILQSMPGGGGVVSANHLYNVAAKDGTVLGTPLSTAMVFAATNPKDVKYDPRRFNWIGSLAGVQDVISVWHTAPAKTLAAAKTTELMMGSTGTGSNTFQDVALANNLLGTKFKPVRGYKGGAEIDIAIERGEVNGRATTWDTWTGSHPDWIRDKKLVHLLQLGPRKVAEVGADVPLLRDLVANAEQRAIVDFIGLSLAMGRAVYAPPEVPKDRVAALRTAFVATMQDPAYIAAMKRLKLDTTSWQPGDAVEKLVADAFSISPALLQKAKAAIELP